MKILVKHIILALIIGLTSCSSSVNDILHGSWVINTFTYNGKDMSNEMVVNIISFSEYGKVRIPKIGFAIADKSEQIGKWDFHENTSQIFLETQSEYFFGYYNLCFKKNFEKNSIRLIIKSDSIYLIAEKFLSENHLIDILPITCTE